MQALILAVIDLVYKKAFEIDASGTQDKKKKVLRTAGIDTAGTVYCSCDFETQNWLDCLLIAVLLFLPCQRYLFGRE